MEFIERFLAVVGGMVMLLGLALAVAAALVRGPLVWELMRHGDELERLRITLRGSPTPAQVREFHAAVLDRVRREGWSLVSWPDLWPDAGRPADDLPT